MVLGTDRICFTFSSFIPDYFNLEDQVSHKALLGSGLDFKLTSLSKLKWYNQTKNSAKLIKIK